MRETGWDGANPYASPSPGEGEAGAEKPVGRRGLLHRALIRKRSFQAP